MTPRIATPLPTHRFNPHLAHTLRCPICWALALGRVGRLAAA